MSVEEGQLGQWSNSLQTEMLLCDTSNLRKVGSFSLSGSFSLMVNHVWKKKPQLPLIYIIPIKSLKPNWWVEFSMVGTILLEPFQGQWLIQWTSYHAMIWQGTRTGYTQGFIAHINVAHWMYGLASARIQSFQHQWGWMSISNVAPPVQCGAGSIPSFTVGWSPKWWLHP